VEYLERIAMRIGALPARRVTWGLVAVFSIWVLLDVFVFKISGGLAQSSYDAMVRARVYAASPDPRIVIVDIDEASLAKMGKEFGRWPWPRDTLATVLDYIEKQQPSAIIWDLLFSDADRMSPGGDAAFDAAAGRSQHSHFSVVRLPAANDGASEVTRSALPSLWVSGFTPPAIASTPQSSTVALIPPALPHIASSSLGFNNGYVDADGVLRRYRYLERLPDGGAIRSIAMGALSAVNPAGYRDYVTKANDHLEQNDALMVWRKKADAYPHVSFADVFAIAEGGETLATAPNFAGKVVIIGATAPSLYDIHPTPLSSMQPGVDSLATALDNAINQRYLHELPRSLQAVLAIALCIGLALWVQFYSVASLAPALLALPITLLGISYLSLNGLPIFIDLHLSAGLALVFLAVLRFWSTLRRNYWCALPSAWAQAMAIWPCERENAWLDEPLDRLIDIVERYAPQCRIVVCDATIIWPTALRWPELVRYAAVVGPVDALHSARAQLEPRLMRIAQKCGDIVVLGHEYDRNSVAKAASDAWGSLRKQERG
jgi:adenylate cyclase